MHPVKRWGGGRPPKLKPVKLGGHGLFRSPPRTVFDYVIELKYIVTVLY